MAERFVTIPLLMLSAPFIAGLWSLMSGSAVVMPLQALLSV
jgi:hypothetical protein